MITSAEQLTSVTVSTGDPTEASPRLSDSCSTISWHRKGLTMQRLVLSLVCAAVFASALAQTGSSQTAAPRPVSLCDLIKNPKAYNAQWIVVRARVSMAFEDFTLYDRACQDHRSDVWLTFGGDQGEITTYCCVNPRRKKDVDIEVEGNRIPLLRDEPMREFMRVLQTQRLRRPDGHPCAGEECYFYRPVTATLTGLFLAGEDGNFPGYGHLGCCHLLVISRVSDVAADRTPVPAGGQFNCSQDAWSANPRNSAEIKSLLACSRPQEQDCDRDRRTAFTRIAAHWMDHVDASTGHADEYGNATRNSIGSWISADLLTSYVVVEEKGRALPNVSITRHVCVPLLGHGPKPSSDRISCNNYGSSWEDDEVAARLIEGLLEKSQFNEAAAKIAEASKSILSEGDQSWRSGSAKSAALHGLQEQARKWKVVPDTTLQSDACDDASLPEQKNHIVGCGWYSRDGMQVFWLSMQKPKATEGGGASGRTNSWVVTSISATVCD